MLMLLPSNQRHRSDQSQGEKNNQANERTGKTDYRVLSVLWSRILETNNLIMITFLFKTSTCPRVRALSLSLSLVENAVDLQ